MMFPTTLLRQSLKSRISIAMLAVFFAGVLLMSLYVSRIVGRDMARMSGEQQISTLALVANQTSSELDNRLKALKKAAG
jgi:hypothetical protein